MSDHARANREAVRRALEGYAVGNLEPLFAILSDEIVWNANAREGQFRFAGTRKGRAGVLEALSLIAADYALERYAIEDLTAEGDTVWSLSRARFLHRQSGSRFEIVLADRWKFAEGRVVRFDEFFDTAAVLETEGRFARVA